MPDSGTDRPYSGPDRRKKQTNPLSLHSLLYGQRKSIREEDRDRHHYVDRYDRLSVVVFMLVIVFSAADALITLRLVAAGGEEINPVMHFFLQYGALPFLVAKYLLTGLGVFFMLIHKEYRFAGTRFSGKYALFVVLLLYLALIVYEIVLLQRLP